MFDIHSIRNRIQNLSDRVYYLSADFCYNSKKDRLKKITELLKESNIWNKPEYITSLKREHSIIENVINKLENLIQKIKDIETFLELILETKDKHFLRDIKTELNEAEIELEKLEFSRMFSGKNDHADCYLDIHAGSGGTEAQDWASMLMRMYLRWAEYHNFTTKIIDETEGEIAGIKSVTIKISGDYAYGWLRTETGIHRLVRKSPFDSSGRRHTSFSAAFVYPEVTNNIDIKINPTDLRIDVFRASGAGGQHVNRTESAVRITHIPTGLVTQCQNDRSQHKNKDQAMKQMQAKFYEFVLKNQNREKKAIESKKSDIRWGNQIRSYILDSSRIKDLRTGIESRNVQSVLNGNLDFFIEKSLKLGL